MKTNYNLSTITLPLVVTLLVSMTRHSDALLMRNNSAAHHPIVHAKSTLLLAANFEQLPGESDMDFIQRITSQSKALLEESSQLEQQEEEEPKKPKGTYQRIEEWDAERKAKGELSWEEKVMFDGQKHGNQVRQNDILLKNLNSF